MDDSSAHLRNTSGQQIWSRYLLGAQAPKKFIKQNKRKTNQHPSIIIIINHD